jgi:hypothetical protein
MKKQLHIAFAFLVLLVTSCATDKLEVQENYNTNIENIWAYDGDNTTIKGVIKELREGTNRVSLERRLLKNDVLWKNAEPLIIEDKKKILVPFLSVDKENIIGFFALYRDGKGKIQYDMTVRSDVYNKKVKLPFWDSSMWAGYFTAYDRTILGKRNGNPGVMKKVIPKEELTAMTSRFEYYCGNIPTGTTCVTVGDECYDDYTGEWKSCGGNPQTTCTTNYDFQCFSRWVDDEPTDTGTGDGGSGGGSGGDPSNPNVIVDKIDDDGLDPCSKGILQKLKNLQQNDLAKIFQKFDSDISLYDININSGSVQIQTNIAETTVISPYSYNITISNNYLNGVRSWGTNSPPTDLSIATTITHEIIHAYLLSVVDEYNVCGTSTICDFPSLYNAYVANKTTGGSQAQVDAQHNLIAEQFVYTMALTIQEFHTNEPVPSGFPYQVYLDLAWAGLVGTDIFNKNYPNDQNHVNYADRQRILSRNYAETYNESRSNQNPIGQPCN